MNGPGDLGVRTIHGQSRSNKHKTYHKRAKAKYDIHASHPRNIMTLYVSLALSGSSRGPPARSSISVSTPPRATSTSA